MQIYHNGATINRPETTKTLLPPIAEVVWQELPVTFVEMCKLVNNIDDFTIENIRKPNMSELRQ